MGLTQIDKRTGVIERVPHGQRPVIELHLVGEQYVTSVSLEEIDPYSWHRMERKTKDWKYEVYVVTPL